MTKEIMRPDGGRDLKTIKPRKDCLILSDKQVCILAVIKNRSLDDHGKTVDIDLDQLLERLSYRTSKESMQFSLRALIRHGLIDKAGNESRRGRLRVLYAMTEDGLAVASGEENAARRSGLVGKTPTGGDGENPIGGASGKPYGGVGSNPVRGMGKTPISQEEPDFPQELAILTEMSASEGVADLDFEVKKELSDPRVSSPVSDKVPNKLKVKSSRKSKTSIKKQEPPDPRVLSLEEILSSISEELELPPEELFE